MGAVAIEEEEGDIGIDFISLPSIDVQSFCGDELRLVAQFSGHFPEASFDDIVVPILDRTSFNESVGSRKQTYGDRARSSGRKASKRGFGSPVTAEERSIGLKSEVHGHAANGRIPDGAGATPSSAKAVVARLISKRKAKSTVVRQVVWKREAARDVTWCSNGEGKGRRKVEELGSGEDLLRTDLDGGNTGLLATILETAVEGILSAGATKGAGADGRVTIGSVGNRSVEGIAVAGAETCSRTTLGKPVEAFENSECEEVARRNGKRSSSSRDSREDGSTRAKRNRLGLPDRKGGPLLESRRRKKTTQRTERVEKHARIEGEMVDMLAKMKGEWSSSERTRKIVEATGFPAGWTVGVGLSRKNGRTLFEYRNWRSPEGTQWPSFKDAAAFLLSSIRLDSAPEIVPLVNPRRGICSDEEIPAVKKEGAHDTVCTGREDLTSTHSFDLPSQRPSETLDNRDQGQGGVHKLGLCGQQVSGIHLDQCVDVRSVLDKTPILARSSIEEEAASHADELIFEQGHRKVPNSAETRCGKQSACEMRCSDANEALLEKHCDCARLTKTSKPSRETDLISAEKKLNLGSTARGMKSRLASVPSNNRDAVCCSGLMPNSNPGHECSVCGMMFSTLLKLRRHSRRAKHALYFKCDVCGRHFSSTALLLGHRVQLGHPRAAKVTRDDSTRSQSQGPEPLPKSSGSEMFNIVLGLLSDTYGGLYGNGDHPSSFAEMPTKLPTENMMESRVILTTGVTHDAEKISDLSDVFECNTCQKVFYHRSQYRSHLSFHSKQRKKALTPRTLPQNVSKKPARKIVDLKAHVAKTGSQIQKSEPGDQCIAKSVFWKLLMTPTV